MYVIQLVSLTFLYTALLEQLVVILIQDGERQMDNKGTLPGCEDNYTYDYTNMVPSINHNTVVVDC